MNHQANISVWDLQAGWAHSGSSLRLHATNQAVFVVKSLECRCTNVIPINSRFFGLPKNTVVRDERC